MSEDTLRDELGGELFGLRFERTAGGRLLTAHDAARIVDALLPRIRQEIEQARADERERIAQALERVPDELHPVDVFGGPWDEATAKRANDLLRGTGLPVYDRVGAQIMRHACRQMARMLREVGDPDA